MAEWFNAAVLKTVEGASPPRVRISASPPITNSILSRVEFFFVAEIRLERRKACSRRAELAQNEAVHYL